MTASATRFRLTPPKAPPPSEAYVQATIIEYLFRRGIPYSVTDAGRMRCRCGQMVSSKVTPGWPDLTACYKGRFIGIEVKKKTGRVSKDTQAPMHDRLREHFAVIIVARSVEDVHRALSELS